MESSFYHLTNIPSKLYLVNPYTNYNCQIVILDIMDYIKLAAHYLSLYR